MRKLIWLLFIGFFFLNPGAACSDEPDFQYGAEEMRAAVVGDWSLTIALADAEPIAVTIHVDQAPTAPGATARAPGRSLVRAAHACGTRTLVKSAAACTDNSQMPLALDYVAGDASLATATMSGSLLVDGLTFTSGLLYLAIDRYRIDAEVKPDGAIVSPYLEPGTTNPTATVTLRRL
jgi:hypothetical protein